MNRQFREDTGAVSVSAAMPKSRSEQRTGKPESGEPSDGSSAVNGQAVFAALSAAVNRLCLFTAEFRWYRG